ncbi:hypothetical protein D3C81_2016500 [compost metagenome]
MLRSHFRATCTQLILCDVFGHGYDGFLLADLLQNVLHFSFQMQPVIKNNIGLIQLAHISL